jgi:hypothetical protein
VSIIHITIFTFFTLLEKEAKILFDTCKLFVSDSEPLKSNYNSRYDTNKNSQNVDVRYLGLFFALQLFVQRSKTIIIDTRDKNPLSFNYFSTPLSSPRGKSSTSRSQSSSVIFDYQVIVNFMKSNIKLFLRLIASDIHNTETSLNSNEFNTLKFLFRIGNEINTNKSANFSNYAPFFMNFSTTTKINIDIISEWLSNLIYTGPSTSNFNFSINFDTDDMVSLKNLSKCVTIKEGVNDRILKIAQCEDSYIYINSNVLHLKILNCQNCTIIVAAVNKITSIEKCENCHICIASNFLRISNSIDTYVYSYSVTEPILFGDNRGVVLAPHNVYFDDLLTNLKNSKISFNSQYCSNFMNPINMNAVSEIDAFQIMQPKDFSILVTPFTITSTTLNYLSLTPKEYSDVIIEREMIFNKVQQMIKDANFTEEQEKAFHVAVQGYFREWLVSTGSIKAMTDIVKMIDLGGNMNTFNTNFDSNK